MNQIVNKVLLGRDKIIPEIDLKQPGFIYNACGPFTKNKQRIQKLMQTGDTNYIYKNELNKACFQHDMAYGDFKDLARRKQSDKVLKEKACVIANNPKYDGYQKGLASIRSISFLTRNQLKGTGIKSMPNQQLAIELHKPIIRKFKKKNVYFF